MSILPFSSLPILLKMAIFKKFTYEQFANFEECSSASHHFCETNRYLKFPFNVDCLFVQKDKVRFWVQSSVKLYFQNCPNVTFRVIHLQMDSRFLISLKQLDFLLNHVTESEELMLTESPQYANQFHYKLRIQRLHIWLETDEREFPYTTKWMKQLDIRDADSLSLETVFSLKVDTLMVRHLRKMTVEPIVNCVKDLLSGKVDFKLKYIKYLDPNFQIHALKKELESMGNSVIPGSRRDPTIEHVPMEMSTLPFTPLPYSLKMAIFEKFTYEQFVTFEECSFASLHFCQRSPSLKFPFEVEYDLRVGENAQFLRWNWLKEESEFVEIPLQMSLNVAFHTERLTLDKCSHLTMKVFDFLANHVPKAKKLYVIENLQVSNQIQQLFKRYTIQELTVVLNGKQSEFPYTIEGMKKLIIYEGANLSLERVISLNVESLKVWTLTKMTVAPIVNCVKDWISGKLDFQLKYISFEDKDFQLEELRRELKAIGDGVIPSTHRKPTKFSFQIRRSRGRISGIIFVTQNRVIIDMNKPSKYI